MSKPQATELALVDERGASCRDASDWVERKSQPPRVIADQWMNNHTLVGWLCVYSLLGCLILGASITARMFGRVVFQVLG
jgi:hypothetical protein